MTTFRMLAFSAALISPLALGMGCAQNGTIGTSHEVSHSESNSKGWFGGQTHEANTVYKNSDGSTSVETETTTTKDGTTKIVRERKTTNLDGTVSVQHQTRTMVKGSDTYSESNSAN